MENETEIVTALTVEDFIRVFRPDGHGHISFVDFEGNIFDDVAFDEIICDLCNAEIVQPEDQPFKAVVFVTGSNALCEECMHRIEDEGEDPSLLITALEDYRRWFDGDEPSDIEKRLSIDFALHIQQLKGGEVQHGIQKD